MKTAAEDSVKAQFAKTAEAYVTSPGHAKGAELARMVELAGDLDGKDVLDVATGGGHTARAFARAGARVTATDLTPEMLDAARRFLGRELAGKGAVAFREAAAEDLPFPDGSFDVVTCRIAAHHFDDPPAFVAGAARVLKRGGLFMLVDNIVPEDLELAEAMNHIEKQRDPSHRQAYSVRQWVEWLAGQGLELQHLSRWRTRKPYAAWLERARTPVATGERLERFVLGLPQAARDYFAVETEGGRLAALAHEAVLIVAQKPPG